MSSSSSARRLAIGLALVASGCAHLAPVVPRFVTVYDERTAACRIHVVRDTRSSACFVSFQCGRHPPAVLPAASEVCVP